MGNCSPEWKKKENEIGANSLLLSRSPRLRVLFQGKGPRQATHPCAVQTGPLMQGKHFLSLLACQAQY